jgi:lactoylglutathione lyase
MELGAFSISLTVKDLATSREFYEKLGFEVTGGSAEQNYLIMANGLAVIGLFHGMFDKNILTFNPGIAQDKSLLSEFTDVREIRNKLVDTGIELSDDTDPGETGPAHISFVDPDGNPILIDQFFPKPEGS